MIKRYKKNHNLVMLSSKVTTVNDIMSTLNTSRGNTTIPLKVQPIPSIDLTRSKVSVHALALNRMFLTKLDPLR